MQYCTALPSDRRNKATRRERLVSLGAAGTMSYLHLGKIDPNGMFWQFGVGMRVSPEVTEYHTSWYIAQYDAWQMTPWFIPAPRGEADEVPETFGHQRNCALIKYGSSMQKSLWNFKKSPSFPKIFQTFLRIASHPKRLRNAKGMPRVSVQKTRV